MKRLSYFFIAIFVLAACSKSVVVSTNLEGTVFPSVSGESLEKKIVKIPEDFKGSPAILLIGYLQKAQFDIDRWILGLLQVETKTKFVEVPTIAGMMPEMVQSFISNGMRRGIPESDWKNVVTVFSDAEKIVTALGNEKPSNAYVVLIDSDGKIVKVYKDGYSPTNVIELSQTAKALEAVSP